MREIHDIHGGIHPPERKSLSRPGELRDAPLPTRLILPLRQHLGVPAKAIVEVGDTVLGGHPTIATICRFEYLADIRRPNSIV